MISVQELPAFGHRIASLSRLNDHFVVRRQFCIPTIQALNTNIEVKNSRANLLGDTGLLLALLF